MLEKCPNTRNVIIFGRNPTEKKALIFNPACGNWSCEYCSEMLKLDWQHTAMRGVSLLEQAGCAVQFITLTSRGYTTPASSLHFFKTNWPKLRKRASRRTDAIAHMTGTQWAYFLIPERTRAGVLHCHLLAATHLSNVRWWKDNAYACGFGHQADVSELVTPADAAGYVAKYLHKDAGGIEWPKHFRRVRHSQNWPKTKPRQSDVWYYEHVSDYECWLEKHALIDVGWYVADKREHSA